MTFVFLAVGLGAGFLIGWLFSKNAGAAAVEQWRIKSQTSESERAAVNAKLDSIQQQRDELRSASQTDQQKLLALTTTFTAAQSEVAHLKERLSEQKMELENLQERFAKEFENLANRILDEKSQKFVEQNRSNMDVILNPLKEKIQDFEKKVDAAYRQESVERNSLRGEIKNLMELNQRINEEAENLTRALKGDTKKQGNWGEFILEKILESSGLEKGREYDTQFSITDDEGRRFQPDVIVRLPDEKHIIVDSKVSLVAYEAMVNATSDVDRDRFMKDHLMSVRNHIKGLSEKSYDQLPGLSSPDFVLLFIPIESSFGVTFQADRDLFTFAWERRIIMVSPSTLLATLRTIASVWKQDRQTKNALEIARVGGGLYDKFKGFLDDMIEVGRKMELAKTTYADAMSKLHTGSGNIIRRVEDLKRLGAKTNKELPAALVERSSENQDS